MLSTWKYKEMMEFYIFNTTDRGDIIVIFIKNTLKKNIYTTRKKSYSRSSKFVKDCLNTDRSTIK